MAELPFDTVVGAEPDVLPPVCAVEKLNPVGDVGWLTYERWENGGLILGAMASDGLTTKQICAGVAFGGLEFAADGAVLLLLGPFQGWPSLSVVEPDGKATTLVKNGLDIEARFDPSGRYILFTTRKLGEDGEDLYVFDRETNSTTLLKQGPWIDFRFLAYERLLVAVQPEAQFYIGRADGSGLELLSLPPRADPGGIASEGEHIIYREGQYPDEGLVVARLDGSEKREVARSEQGYLLRGELSPNSQFVLFQGPDRSGERSVRAEFINLATNESQSIVDSSDELTFGFSPDNRWALVFSTIRTSNTEGTKSEEKSTLYVINTGDGKVVQEIADVINAYFSPDSSQLAYTGRKADDTLEMYVMTLDSGATQSLGPGSLTGWFSLGIVPSTATPTPIPPVAVLTPISPTPTPVLLTPAPVLPTATPTPTPTRIPSAVPMSTPEGIVLSPPLKPFVCPSPRTNDFSSAGDFWTFDEEFARGEVISGEYCLKMKEADSWAWTNDGVKATNAIFEVDVRQTAAGPGPYGLAFGADKQDNLYAFVIDSQGYYALLRHTNAGDWIELQEFTSSFHLNTGDEPNHLVVVRSGPLIALYANGIPLTTSTYDDTYASPGYAGLIAWSGEAGGLEARFDNYTVCPLTQPYPMPVYVGAEQTLRWPTDQPVVLYWRWLATTRSLAQSFADLADFTLSVDGQEFRDLQEYWSAVSPSADAYMVEWNFPLPALPAGAHRIEYNLSLQEQVADGYDDNEDGKPDTYGPGEVFSGWVELNVGAPTSLRSTATPIPPTPTPTPASALPTYSEILKTYPEGVELCTTDAELLEAHPDGSVDLSGTISYSDAGGFQYQCYGTKITVKVRSTLDGKTYEPGARLTVDKDLNWIEVSSWD